MRQRTVSIRIDDSTYEKWKNLLYDLEGKTVSGTFRRYILDDLERLKVLKESRKAVLTHM